LKEKAMWKSIFTKSRILAILGEGEAGVDVVEVYRKWQLMSG
jgi:hypothetical protein